MQMEAHGSVSGTGKRPDNFAVSPDGSAQVAIDVRTCVTTSPTNCAKAAQSPCYAADQGSAIKLQSWLPFTEPAGLSFVPFCVEEGGRFGDGCHFLIDLFASSLNSLTSTKEAFKTYALNRLHLANQRGVARVINALKPIPTDPHVVVTPTTYELAPPPPRPQPQAAPPSSSSPSRRPLWAFPPIEAQPKTKQQASRNNPSAT